MLHSTFTTATVAIDTLFSSGFLARLHHDHRLMPILCITMQIYRVVKNSSARVRRFSCSAQVCLTLAVAKAAAAQVKCEPGT